MTTEIKAPRKRAPGAGRKPLEGGIVRVGITLTPADLRAWQAHMGISGREAARRLGVSPGTYQDWVTGTSRTTKKPIALPPMLGLACAALAAGLGEWSAPQA